MKYVQKKVSAKLIFCRAIDLRLMKRCVETNEWCKGRFQKQLKHFVSTIQDHISTKDGQWSVKGLLTFSEYYTISSIQKLYQSFRNPPVPKILEFSRKHGYKVVLAEHQNHYPDISFVKADDELVFHRF